MIQSTDPERLDSLEGPAGDTWTSPGRGNRRDFLIDLGTNRDGKQQDWVEGWVDGECTERDDWRGRAFGGQVETRCKRNYHECTRMDPTKTL